MSLMNETVECYKIMERSHDGSFKTLFHGVDGSKTMPFDTWVEAERKWAGEGKSRYWTGFHVLLSKEMCEKYFDKFTVKENRVVIRVLAKDLVLKESSHGKVFLARWMMVPKES